MGLAEQHAPSLHLMCSVCKSMNTWLSTNLEHMLLLHCKVRHSDLLTASNFPLLLQYFMCAIIQWCLIVTFIIAITKDYLTKSYYISLFHTSDCANTFLINTLTIFNQQTHKGTKTGPSQKISGPSVHLRSQFGLRLQCTKIPCRPQKCWTYLGTTV